MKKLTAFVATAVLTVGSAVLPLAVSAQSGNPFTRAQQYSNTIGQQATGGQPVDLQTMIGRIINILLGFIGIILLLIILYAGFLWMTAGGDEGQVKKAKAWIANSVVGLIIVVAAFAISSFVLGSLINVSQ